jgi:hypothetical protein
MQAITTVTEIMHAVPGRTTGAVAARLRRAFVQTAAWSQSAAGAVSFLIRSLALASGVLGVWRLGIDVGWTQDFVISAGVWSHWQVWLALAAALNAAASFVLRAARRDDAKSQ